jgi:hypothetical protein
VNKLLGGKIPVRSKSMMTAVSPQYEDDIVERGIAFYENHLKNALERDYSGQTVAIDPDSGDYAIGNEASDAVRLLRKQHSSGLFFVRRIGPPTAGDRRFAARITAAEMKKK